MRISSVIMLTGFAIITVPTGIVTAELGREVQAARSRRHCQQCGVTLE
jgi:voltage-gated potassium channel